MSASGGMSQLLKGIIIGIVLIMAIIGTMTLLDKGNPLSNLTKKDPATVATNETKEIVAPSITLNPDNSQTNKTTNNNSNIGDLNAEIPEDEQTPITNNNEAENNNSIEPILENERTAEEAKIAPVTFGLMELKAINPSNNQTLKANYVVYDKNNVKVAESKEASNTSYRLPSGQYKVETTLTKIDEATNQSIPVITKSRYIIVRANSTSRQTFELKPPATSGVLQVSAKMNDQIVRANFVIQKANGEIVASRNNVSNSLFKLNTGSYKVSVTSGNNKDFRSVEIKAGESTQTIFILKEAATQGELLVRVFDTGSNNPVRADITITTAKGAIVQDLKASTQTELTLAAGDYKISVIGPNGRSNKNVRVNSGQALNEVFRFDAPNTNNASTSESNSNTTQINENVTIKPVETQKEAPIEAVDIDSNKVTLNVIAQDEITRKPIKSNVYIQTLQGKHLDKKTYVDAASFSLEPGVYKVTVRASNRKNNVKTIRISKNENLSETFLLAKPNTQTAANSNQKEAKNIAIKPTKSVNQATIIATGFLNVAMQAPNNQQANRNDLRTHFIVSTITGQKIVELTSVNVGNFKLDVGSYIVTAIYNNKRQKRRVNVRQNQNTRLNFNTQDFLAAKGVLRSQIVNESGRPLKGNLIVKNMSGQVVARASNVSSAIFNLPPTRHTISVNFEGLSGTEIININANETTVQTFTIAPTRNTGQNNNTQQSNEQRDIKDILRDKIKKEIRRTF